MKSYSLENNLRESIFREYLGIPIFMQFVPDPGAGSEGRLVLRVEDLDGALLPDPVAHLEGMREISFSEVV